MPINKKIFIEKKLGSTPGFAIGALMRKKEVKGDIGIEIEVEGNKFKKQSIPAPWTYHKDGSLRGHDNAEYVLGKPIEFRRVPEAIGILWDMFKDYGSVLDESNRTSVHVHLNVQKFHLNRLCSFMGLFFSVEELLTAWCGDHRIGNLFCLRAKDAPAIVSHLKKFFVNDGQYDIKDGMHYAGLNAQAMQKFGSLEIRSLRGVNDPQVILDWVSILERIYKLSAEFPDPRAVVDGFSGQGPLAYLDMVLGDKVSVLKKGIDYTDQQIMEALYDGIRLAQDLCYCRDWSLYEPVDLKSDPFGRDAKKVADQMAVYESGLQHYNTAPATSLFSTGNMIQTGWVQYNPSPAIPVAPSEQLLATTSQPQTQAQAAIPVVEEWPDLSDIESEYDEDYEPDDDYEEDEE